MLAGETELDVNNLLNQENLFFDNCILTRASNLIGFHIDADKVILDSELTIDQFELSAIGYHFSVEINGSVYAGGEGLNHGSYGFFYKKTDGKLNWALMALESNPFASVMVLQNEVRFLSTSGLAWVVPGDDIANVFIVNDDALKFFPESSGSS